MPATIQLRKGDMFGQPADLIVIPCSTGATITQQIAERLDRFNIRPPNKVMELGEVQFKLFEEASSIATYVGYAASVDEMESSSSAITRIADSIAKFVREKPEIRNISLPLLGSGAGGLSARRSAEALYRGLNSIGPEDKVFNIYVYNGADFDRLTNDLSSLSEFQGEHDHSRRGDRRHRLIDERYFHDKKKREPIRVFISYTKSNDQHQKWVRDLAAFLRENGINARLDMWDLRPGMDLPQWMSNELAMADRVLIICNKDYAARADGRIGGVGWEIKLVQGDLLQTQQYSPRKYIPIIHDEYKDEAVPKFLQGTYCIVWCDDKERCVKVDLLKELYEAYEHAPPLGAPPRFVLR